MKLVCKVIPWKGGRNNNLNGFWVDDPSARDFIIKHSLPQPTSQNQYRHIIEIYLPSQYNGLFIIPQQSLTFGNNGNPIQNPSSLQSSFFWIKAAKFTCTHFLACTNQNCHYHRHHERLARKLNCRAHQNCNWLPFHPEPQ